MNSLSSTLSYLMSEKAIKSAELARKTGIGQPVIHRLMTGVTDNPQVFTIKPIADFFNISIDQLLGLTSLTNSKLLNDATLHEVNNKLLTIKTITSVLVDLLPALIEGYKKAISAHLQNEEIPQDILPLLTINSVNLLRTVNQLQELLINNKLPMD